MKPIPWPVVIAALVGCSGAQGSLGSADAGDGASGSSSGGGSGGSGGSSSGGGSGGGSGSGSGSGSSSGGGSGGGSGSSSGGNTDSGACPPCDPANVNLKGSGCDLDCSGTTDPPGPCDSALTAAGPAGDFAKAIGLCQAATGSTWGLVSAAYTQGYNTTTAPNAGQHGILPSFGSVIVPREGAMLGVLSSGWASTCDDPSATASCAATGTGDPYFKGGQTAMDPTVPGTAPPGYPKSTGSCAVVSTVADVVGVTLKIKVPKNAAGMSFDFDFYSSEWPEYVCSMFNDSFVAWLQSTAWGGHGTGDFNLAFDQSGNCISVNNPFLTRCTPGTPTGCMGTASPTSTCPGGPTELQGTGFYNLGVYCTSQSTGGGATGWLTTTAPVTGGEIITLQFIIWDTGDPNWDSSVLIDHLTWYGTPKAAETTLAQ